MLRSIRRLVGFSVGVSDGDLGLVGDFVFDKRTWTVRYAVVETGEWSAGQGAEFAYVTEQEVERVLVSPTRIAAIGGSKRHVSMSLTRAQVRKGRSINPNEPISKQLEASDKGTDRDVAGLHFVTEMFGCHLVATDGAIGHVTDLVVDDETWAILYAVVATHNWWPGNHVLIATAWIGQVQWKRREAFVCHSRKAIRGAPAWSPRVVVDRRYERRLNGHYGQPNYWEQLAEVRP